MEDYEQLWDKRKILIGLIDRGKMELSNLKNRLEVVNRDLLRLKNSLPEEKRRLIIAKEEKPLRKSCINEMENARKSCENSEKKKEFSLGLEPLKINKPQYCIKCGARKKIDLNLGDFVCPYCKEEIKNDNRKSN